MSTASQLVDFDQKVMNFLATYIGEWPYYRDTVISLWKNHLRLGFTTRLPRVNRKSGPWDGEVSLC